MQKFISFFGSIFLMAGSLSAANFKIILVPQKKELKNIKIIDLKKKNNNSLNCGTIDCTAIHKE